MRKTKSRFLATLLIIIMLSGMVSFTGSASAQEISITGQSTTTIYEAFNTAITNAGPDGTVNVVGSTTIASTLNLNIPADRTVNWRAALSGTVSGVPLINIGGGGTFNVYSTLESYGASAGSTTITVSGSGTAINVKNDGAVIKGGAHGNAILVSASSVIINVEAGGEVKSLSSDDMAAIQIGAFSEVVIISAGSIVSEGNSGNAIFDNGYNTEIIISGGRVNAGSTIAIRSSTAVPTAIPPTKVTISGNSEVTNAAGGNFTPTIYVGGNVTVSGSALVQNTHDSGYTIQTSGNVTVSGNAQVLSRDGRAINLVGLNSIATVSDNATVSATGTGTAISTATTAPETVINAGVVINGGTVSAASSGSAIRITGENSFVTVNGGTVETTSGDAIHVGYSGAPATNAQVTVNGGTVETVTGNAIQVGHTATYSAANAQVTVSGGTVRATGGAINSYAIRALGTGGRILITDTRGSSDGGGDVDRGGQVAVFREGAAIYTPGPVTVNGGFVFAYGTNSASAIRATGGLTGPSTNYGVVVVWDSPGGPYQDGEPDDLTPTVGSTTWGVDAAGTPGINYVNTGRGATLGFFPLADVELRMAILTVIATTGGTIEGDPSGTKPVGSLISVSANANSGYHFTGWTAIGIDISADEILAKPIIFNMPDDNVILTANFLPNPAATYTLSVFGGVGGTVSGTGSGAYPEGYAVSVFAEADDGWHFTEWTIVGDDVELEGDISTKPAIFNMPANAVTITANFEQNPVYPVETYTLNVIGGVGGTVFGTDSGAYPEGYAVSVFAEANAGWYFINWTVDGVTLARGDSAKPAVFDMPAGAVTITALFRQNPPDTYTLNVLGCVNGTVTGTSSGAYPEGSPVSVTAVADRGYRFSRWIIDGVEVPGGNTANPLEFGMPPDTVTIKAEFVYVGVPRSPPADVLTEPPADVPVPAVRAAPPTGVNRNLILPIVMLTLGLLTVTGAEIYRRGKKKASKK